MSLGGLKGKIGLKAAPAKKEVKRPLLALGDDEEDDSGKQQEISGWDAAEGGAVDIGGPKEKEAPRVIPALPNRNWREDAQRRQLSKAPHTKAQNTEVTEQMEQPQIQYGLTILKKEDQQDTAVGEDPAPTEPMEDVQDTLTEEQRLEKNALDALINGKPADEALIIPLHADEDAFQSDLRSAPDAPSLDAYEATPIEGFGAALLRGMGWKDDDGGKNGAPAKIKQVKPRPALLGIGAKEDAAAGVELGDFKGTRAKGKNKLLSYNPVALRNKNTGEVITEEELKAKLELQDMVREEPRKEGRRREDDGERRRNREREKRREKDDYDDRRDRRKDKYRDEEYDSERRREKRRDRDDDYDRREKRREDDYDSERRRDKRRERSRSPSDKKLDRYRSRSRDSKRDRDRRDRSRDSKRRREYGDEREERRRRH